MDREQHKGIRPFRNISEKQKQHRETYIMKTVIIIALTVIIGTGYLVAQKATSTVQTVVTERNELLAQIK